MRFFSSRNYHEVENTSSAIQCPVTNDISGGSTRRNLKVVIFMDIRRFHPITTSLFPGTTNIKHVIHLSEVLSQASLLFICLLYGVMSPRISTTLQSTGRERLVRKVRRECAFETLGCASRHARHVR